MELSVLCRRIRTLAMIMVFALTLAGCEGDDGDRGPAGPAGPPGSDGPAGPPGPGTDPAELGGITAQWQESAHADETSEAFNHWNADGEIPVSCAKCHSLDGFRDYAEDEVVDDPAPIGTVISCSACHSTTLYDDADPDAGVETQAVIGAPLESYGTGLGIKDGVTFPSGDEVTLNGPSNMCMTCHQGRASTVDVNEAIGNSNFGFINIHYFAAAATLFGTEVQGGYEYDGKQYVGQFTHVPQYDTCVDCHMGPNRINHTMEPKTEYCVDCHAEVDMPSDPANPFRDIRRSAPADFDGDGDATEGMYFEINDTLVPALLTAIQDYAVNTIGTAIAYDPAAYPYFFVDTNGNGVADADEANFGNRYQDFDAELLRAAYNYQVTQKEPCGYVHNALYVLQLLYDSIEAVGGDVSSYSRPAAIGNAGIVGEWSQSGHGDVGAEAWEHWSGDDPAEIPTSCAKCHSAEGFRDFAADGTVDVPVPVSTVPSVENTLTCGGCHQNSGAFAASQFTDTLYADMNNLALDPVTFPAEEFAAEFGFPAGTFQQTFMSNSNMCMSCHQGRESGLSVQSAIDALDTHSFINRHYFAAAAILFGTEVKAGYEYEGRTYLGQNTYPQHPPTVTECVDCHLRGDNLDHNFVPRPADCAGCHADVPGPGPGAGGTLTSFELLGAPFGGAGTDYDGNGTAESFQAEIDGMLELLLSEVQAYAASTLGTAIVYAPGSYPYWFLDNGLGDGGVAGDGIANGDEATFANRFTSFDDSLLAAAFNFHSGQDPCGDMHNYKYVLQTLHDSIADLGGDVTALARPGGAGGVEPPPTNGGGGGTIDGQALYTGGGCGSCHGPTGEGVGSFPNIQNITLATLQSASPGVAAHGTISTWTTEEQEAVVDFLTNPL